MKKILAILLILIMIISSSVMVHAVDETGNVYINVGLYYMTTAVKELTIESEYGFILADKGRYTYAETADYSDYTKLVARVSGSNVNVYDDQNVLVIGNIKPTQALISAAENFDSRIISVEGKEYRIGICFGAYGDGTMAAANYVDMEHYLWGVVSAEMTYSNPMEALKAQAVACRSFAVASIGGHGGGALPFDVCTKSHCQVYKGVAGEYDSTTKACMETAGEVISYNGKIAKAYYHSNSFGYTLSAEQVWGSDIPYCQSVYDPYTGEHNWATSFSFSEIETRLKAHGKGVGTLKSVSVGSRYDNGAVASLVFTGVNGSVTISRSTIMSYFNLKSLAFSISGSPEPQIIKSGGITVNVYGKGSSNLCSGSFYAVDASGKVTELQLSDILCYDGNQYGEAVTNNEAVQFTEEVVTSGTLYLAGLGYGHCVGMDQSGARGMARSNFKYDQILKHYYTGVTICDLHEVL